MKLAILYDDVDARPEATADERGVLEAVEAVRLAVLELGHEPLDIPVGSELNEWADRLSLAAVDVAFNLCEGVGGTSDHEERVAAVVELMGLRMTGSTSSTLALAKRKDRVNALLGTAGLPVAPWIRVDPGSAAPAWNRYPAIVKPVAEDASVGITQASVVRDGYDLATATESASRFGDLLVQEFLIGSELMVGFVGDRVLPVAEIDFGVTPFGHWPLVGYRAKWEPGSIEDRATPARCPAAQPPTIIEEAISFATAAWRLVDGRGYGRVDLRANAAGELFILEVNPNPDLSPRAGLARMAAAGGWGYVDLVGWIIEEATQ